MQVLLLADIAHSPAMQGLAGRHQRASARDKRQMQRMQTSIAASAPVFRRLVHTKAAMTEVSVFLEEIAVQKTPKNLGALIRVLESQGGKALAPTQREGLHPLLVPLCSLPATHPAVPQGSAGEAVACLLRWPQPSQHKSMLMPLVSMERGSRKVHLVARSVDEHLHRLLAEEDIAAGDGSRPVAEAAGPEGSEIYKPGDAAAAGFSGPKANLYVVRKVGMFPDVCESLAAGHLKRGDQTSALVASEWYMRNNYFPGWARPYEFAAELFTQLKRQEEARDMARVALRLPWWTLRQDFTTVQNIAQLEGKTPEEVRYALSEEAAAAAQAQNPGIANLPKVPKSKQQLALEHAAGLLDMVAAGSSPSYDAIRSELADSYREAGLSDVANFINAA